MEQMVGNLKLQRIEPVTHSNSIKLSCLEYLDLTFRSIACKTLEITISFTSFLKETNLHYCFAMQI
jgi:hypothetical protein